jgi:hypothetical protein
MVLDINIKVQVHWKGKQEARDMIFDSNDDLAMHEAKFIKSQTLSWKRKIFYDDPNSGGC